MAAQGQTGTGWWSLTLPQNWEAKFDPGQNRYFFIDHETRKTSWEDPRKAIWEKQQQQQQLQQAQALHHQAQALTQHSLQPHQGGSAGHQASPGHSPRISPRHSPAQPRKQEETPHKARAGWEQEVLDKYGMKVTRVEEEEPPVRIDEFKLKRIQKLFPTADEPTIRKLLTKNKNAEGQTIIDIQKQGHARQDSNKSTTIITRLKSEFPTAEESIIRDLVQGTKKTTKGTLADYDEEKVRAQLRSLGYRQTSGAHLTTTASHTSSHASSHGSSHHHHQHQHQHQQQPSPHHTPQRSPQRSPSPAPVEPSEDVKHRRQTKLEHEFPDCAHSVVKIALESCQYDEVKARTLLQSMGGASSAPVSSPARRHEASYLDRHEPRERTSPSHTSAGAASGGSSGAARATSPRRSATATTTSGVSVHVTSPPRSAVSPARAAGSRSGSASPSRSSASPKHTTTRAPAAKSVMPSRARKEQVRSKAKTGPYMSPNRTQSKGAEESLSKGPSMESILDDYVAVKGPNPENHHGPQKENVGGPSSARGPDKSMSHGPDLANRSGPTHEHCQGPVLVSTGNQLLVTQL